MKKILMIKDGYLPDSRVEREALALKNAGYQIYLIYSEKAKGQINSVFEESYLIPLEIKARIYFPKAVNEVAKQYSSIIDKIKPDIIHAHDVMAANIACKVVPENVKFIYDDHEIWEIFTRSKIKKVKGLKQKILQIYIALATKKIVKKILKKADLLVVINEHWIDYYHKKGYPKENIIAIENYVDLNLINEVSKNEHLAEPFIQNDPRRKIIHSSNVQNLSQDINRNVNNIAQAAAELNDWVLIIYGNKDETLEKLGTMFFPQTDRIQYLVNCSKCDVALNTIIIDSERMHYSSSNRLYEFIALGLKVISSKAATLYDKFDNKLIWADPTTSKETIKDLLKNIDKYPSKEEMKELSKKFLWDNEIKRLIERYKIL